MQQLTRVSHKPTESEMATGEKTQWNKLDVDNSGPAIQKAVASVNDALDALAAAITTSAKKKGMLPDGKQVRVLQARGGGYIFAYLDPRAASSGPVAL